MSTEEEILNALRAAKGHHTPVEMADLLGTLAERGLDQSTLIMYFKQAFPEIPLPVLIEAGGWSRVSDCDMTDEDINALLRPWLGPDSANK